MPIIEVDELTKSYDDRVVVDGVSFSVEEGEIFAILGPNGAGKTTTVESIAGLRTPEAGPHLGPVTRRVDRPLRRRSGAARRSVPAHPRPAAPARQPRTRLGGVRPSARPHRRESSWSGPDRGHEHAGEG